MNCAALQENLLESELFGHEKGAFTGADRQRIGRFEQADGGSLFLDEIGDMSASTQAKILRVLQEHEFERLGGTRTIKVDVRLIAATNRDLPAMVGSGTFREDLYYRLNVVTIDMPPLRERKEDILPLAAWFIRRFSSELKKKLDGLDTEAQKMLMRYNWPGNIRELENAIERAALLAETRDDPRRRSAARRLRQRRPRETASAVKIPPTGIALEEIERQALVEALKMSNWVQKDAAELLQHQPARDELQDQDAQHRDAAAKGFSHSLKQGASCAWSDPQNISNANGYWGIFTGLQRRPADREQHHQALAGGARDLRLKQRRPPGHSQQPRRAATAPAAST